MLGKIRTNIKQKGQGIVEYALLLAFVVGIGMMLSGSNLGSAVKGVFEDVTIALEGNKYAPYFKKWHDKTSAWLLDPDNASEEERLQADREALARIARAFIGLKQDGEDGVEGLIKKLSYNRDQTSVAFNNANDYKEKEGANGWSNTLVPLSYRENDLEVATYPNNYIHLDWAGNVETVKLLTNDAETHRGGAPDNQYTTHGDNSNGGKKNTGVNDRIFYSNGMIGDNANDKMVTLQVHYKDGVVDQVNIQARDIWANQNDNQRKANKDKYGVVDGLNLNVTKTEITPISSQNN